MDSYDPQQIAEDREIIAEAEAKRRIRPLFPTGEPTTASTARGRHLDDAERDARLDLGPPLGDDPAARGSGHGEGL
jgi:hypothetical protein